jgi:hypothetical protein
MLYMSSDLKPSISSLKSIGSWTAPAILMRDMSKLCTLNPFWHSVDWFAFGWHETHTLWSLQRRKLLQLENAIPGVVLSVPNLGQLHRIITLEFLGLNLLWPEIQLEVYLIKQELVLWVHAQNVVWIVIEGKCLFHSKDFCVTNLKLAPKPYETRAKTQVNRGENCEFLNRVGALPDRTNRLLKKQIP